MAEDKKKDDKKAPAGTPASQELTYLLVGLFILGAILAQAAYYINSIGWGNFTNVWNYFLHSYFFPFWAYWKVFAVILSAAAILWIIYTHRKMKEVLETEKNMYGEFAKAAPTEEGEKKDKNEKWERVLEHANSGNASDWRLAIMEADILLEEVLRSKGFPGDTLGEMLKSAEGSGFVNLQSAWEAHKVRNRIAHSGGDFQLNERETQRVISHYEAVFREFEII